MIELKKRISFEQATQFKIEYLYVLDATKTVYSREFNSAQSLAQWAARNDPEDRIHIMIIRRLALLGDHWEPYTTIGKRTITLTALKTIVRDLETTI